MSLSDLLFSYFMCAFFVGFFSTMWIFAEDGLSKYDLSNEAKVVVNVAMALFAPLVVVAVLGMAVVFACKYLARGCRDLLRLRRKVPTATVIRQ